MDIQWKNMNEQIWWHWIDVEKLTVWEYLVRKTEKKLLKAFIHSKKSIGRKFLNTFLMVFGSSYKPFQACKTFFYFVRSLRKTNWGLQLLWEMCLEWAFLRLYKWLWEKVFQLHHLRMKRKKTIWKTWDCKFLRSESLKSLIRGLLSILFTLS